MSLTQVRCCVETQVKAGGCCHSFEEEGYDEFGCCHSLMLSGWGVSQLCEEEGYEFDSGEMLSPGWGVLSQLRGSGI